MLSLAPLFRGLCLMLCPWERTPPPQKKTVQRGTQSPVAMSGQAARSRPEIDVLDARATSSTT